MFLSIVLLLMGYKEEVPSTRLQREIESFYHVKIVVRKAGLPQSAYYAPNKRYRADSILNYLKRIYPGDHIVALTSVDISTTKNNKKDWGVFGLGSLKDNVCVMSVYKLKSRNLHQRILKVGLHEFGHTLGIEHCTSGEPCFMKEGDHTAAGLDKEPIVLCKRCKQKALLRGVKV